MRRGIGARPGVLTCLERCALTAQMRGGWSVKSRDPTNELPPRNF